MMKKAFLPVMFLVIIAGCSPKTTPVVKNTQTEPTPPITEATPKKEVPRWAPKEFDYKPSETRVHDLLHTRLEVSFDWEKSYLNGKARLTLKPYFYPSKSLVLDAKGMEIREVALWKDGEKTPLQFDYDKMYLTIDLGRIYSRDEEYTIYIDYTAKPEELQLPGSEAITDAKGLYFINADGSDPNKPRQIWTQGETEGSSCWFPTIDAPNERTTQEIYMTVKKNFVTLSNGIMVNSTENADGTRTDYWRQTIPHAPYLFAMAVGEFSVVKDEWNGREVSYYVEPEYEQYARLVFGNTPEMIDFYSKVTGVEYPWEKYSQIVVRDFVSGAMENTTAVIHFGALQHDSREHLDSPMEDIIAHELFHHWFGDLVTCESWPNLPLNESFATYGEYLWNEHKYGKAEADYKFISNLKNYLGEARGKREPLIRFNVRHRDDMFDAHSYQKGSRVLHMLRNHLGDDAFFASIKLYLNQNAFKPAEIHNLRLAFEEVSGQDLNWFFNQWFLNPGHPELSVEHAYVDGKAQIKVSQTQNLDYQPLYRLPLNVEVVTNGKSTIYPIVFDTKDSVFTFPSSVKPDYVVFDADKMLLADIQLEDKPREAWMAQMQNGSSFLQRQAAMEELASSVDNPAVKDLFLKATKDSFWGIRQQAISALDAYMGSDKLAILQRAMELAKKDAKASVRRTGVRIIKNTDFDGLSAADGGAQGADIRKQAVATLNVAIDDSSYKVQSEALKALVMLDREAGLARAKSLESVKNNATVTTVAEIYMDNDMPGAMEYISRQLVAMEDGFGKFQLLNSFGSYVDRQEGEEKEKGIRILKDIGSNAGQWWIRLGAIRAMMPFSSRDDIQDFLKLRLEAESNEDFKNFLKEMIN